MLERDLAASTCTGCSGTGVIQERKKSRRVEPTAAIRAACYCSAGKMVAMPMGARA